MSKNKQTKKELLFSVTKEDCKWDYFRCPGPGGQNVNKVSSGVRCTHPPSGAVGQSCDERQQWQNKKLAFQRMAQTQEFQNWHEMEVARRTGQLARAEQEADKQMNNIRVEVRENGLWKQVDKNATLPDEPTTE